MTKNTPGQYEHRVRDIMTTPVYSVDMDDSIFNVNRLFERERCHHVVVKNHHRAHGVISDRDILKVVSPFVGNKTLERSQDVNTLKQRVHQIMSRNLITIAPDETVTAAAAKMLRERVSCLPVIDDLDAVVGIVTVRDIASWAVTNVGPVGHSEVADQKADILVIIDGIRCYVPDAELAHLIREADRILLAKNGPNTARAMPLPMPMTLSSPS